jgi:hypothetical protein
VSGDGDYLGPTEEVPPEDGDRMQSPKRCVLNKKTEQWLMSRMILVIVTCLSLIDTFPGSLQTHTYIKYIIID